MSEQKAARTIVANVVSDRSDKTIAVAIDRQLRHPVYGKYITRSTKLQVHDEANEARVGDLVKITSCRRFSKTKAWQLVEVVKRTTDTLDTPAVAPLEPEGITE